MSLNGSSLRFASLPWSCRHHALAAINDKQHLGAELESPRFQIRQQRFGHFRVLGGSFPEAQHALLALKIQAQRHHKRHPAPMTMSRNTAKGVKSSRRRSRNSLNF